MLTLITRLLISALASNDIAILITSLLKVYSENSTLKTILNQENVSQTELHQPYAIFNPNIIKKLLNLLQPKELTTLKKELNKINNITNKIDNHFNKTTPNNNNKPTKQQNKLDPQGWVILSSSWFKKGNFYLSNKTQKTGLLLALLQSDTAKNKKWYGPYTYPSVPLEVWELMKIQKGKNGKGAGTIFWNFFLRSFLPSQIRKYVKSQLKSQKNIIKGRKSYYILKHNNINILKTTAFINKLERGFFNKKAFKNLASTEIASKAWKTERRSLFQYSKSKNIGYSIYKTNNKTYKKLGK